MNGRKRASSEIVADWHAIEVECRVSPATLRSIAAKHRVNYHALRQRSLKGGWRRKVLLSAANATDLHSGDEPPARDPTQEAPPPAAEVMPDPAEPSCIPLHRALVAYVNTRHEPGSDAAYTEKAVLEGAAMQLEMVRQHRGDIRTARELALTLLGQLQEVTGCRESIEQAIHDFEDNAARRAAMVRAVALPAHIVAMRDLSTTLRQLIPLERQALGILDHQPLEPSEPFDPADRVNQRPELAELEKAIERTLARTAPTAERVE